MKITNVLTAIDSQCGGAVAALFRYYFSTIEKEAYLTI